MKTALKKHDNLGNAIITAHRQRTKIFLPQIFIKHQFWTSHANIWLYGGEQNRCGTNEHSLAFISPLLFPKLCCFTGRINNGVFIFFFFQICL